MLNLLRLNRNIRSIRRYRFILGVLIEYGFGHVVEQLNINYYLELGRRIVTFGRASKELERLSTQERLRLALEELGPTFIKLGQVLSTRPDLIPKEFADEFSKLQDRVPSIPSEEIRTQIENELEAPTDELFASFNDHPFATASIAQVHRARLHSGEEVVVKVRRPGIEEVIDTDLDILEGLAYLIEHHLPSGDLYDPQGIVKEFRRTLEREMNYLREGQTVDRFAQAFDCDATLRIPKVFWEHTGETVLTLEFIDGIKISEIDRLEKEGYDLKLIASRGADTFLRQVLVHGLFHGDPHPGNLLILPDNVIGMLDYGMVGRLDKSLKNRLADLLLFLVDRDVERIVSMLLYAGDLGDEVDMDHLRRDLSEFIDDYYEMPLQNINTGKLLGDFVDLMTLYRIRFPSDLMLLAKALMTMEGIGRSLDPDFNMIGHLKPFMEKVLRDRVSPSSLSSEALRVLRAYGALASHLPKDLKELINRINRNKFKIDLEHRGLNRLITDLDKSSNRLSFSLLISALIVGSSLIMQTDKGPILFGFPILGLVGYSIAAFLGLWLAIAILRSGRL